MVERTHAEVVRRTRSQPRKDGVGAGVARGEALYGGTCANCHGFDGMKVSTRGPLGEIARGNPWEALHNIRNGHAGVAMPPLQVLDDAQTIVDILAYIQTLPSR